MYLGALTPKYNFIKYENMFMKNMMYSIVRLADGQIRSYLEQVVKTLRDLA